MLNADDKTSVFALRLLRDTIRNGQRPILFWIGSGASRWLGYPTWIEAARKIRSEFNNKVERFDNNKVLRLIEREQLPEVFQHCKDVDSGRYREFISKTFEPRPDTLLYTRFIDKLQTISPVRVVTTNIDESLEQRMPHVAPFQQSDLQACNDRLLAGESFLGKLHGSRSSVSGVVFSTDEYEAILKNPQYLHAVTQIFANATVIFLGYSVRDEYVVAKLNSLAAATSVFGAGPHFVVTSNEASLPAGVHKIGYILNRFPDHRAALSILDFVAQSQIEAAEAKSQLLTLNPTLQSDPKPERNQTRTAYYLSSFYPPGTWQTSQTATAGNGTHEVEMRTGVGFTNDEFPFSQSTALHDLAVGMICFDKVVAPLDCLQMVHDGLGSELFWELLNNSDLLQFIHLEHKPACIVIKGQVLGDVGLISLHSRIGDGLITPQEIVRHVLQPAPGKEKEAEDLISRLERSVETYREAERASMAQMVRSSFLMPDIARTLGIGEAILPNQVPVWVAFPVLRMAHLVHVACICNQFGIQAARIPFGGARLVGAAFGVQSSTELADGYANYVVTGRYSTDADLGSVIFQAPDVVRAILKFRHSSEGEQFRKEVAGSLSLDNASLFNTSLNSGLNRTIPMAILQKAHDKLSSLLTAESKTATPAVFSNIRSLDDSTHLWREKSRRSLLALAKERGIGKSDPCICGSGDKLQLCCLAPLRS